MNAILQIKENYIAEQNKIEAIREKIITREKQIARLKKRKDEQQEKSWWGDLLIRPVLALVKEKFPQLTWDDERLTPMGLRCAVSVFAYEGQVDIGKCVAYLVFTPFKDGLAYDTGKRTNDYSSNSIGGMNGFDNISKEVETIEELFDYIQFQLDKEKEVV